MKFNSTLRTQPLDIEQMLTKCLLKEQVSLTYQDWCSPRRSMLMHEGPGVDLVFRRNNSKRVLFVPPNN